MGQVRPIAPHLRTLDAPEPLRALPGWLMWRYETYSGEQKPRKVPYYVSGTRRHGLQGGPQDRAQLTTFAAARDAAARLGFDGVGLAMLPDWGITAIDVDHCVDPDGNLPEDIESIAQRTYAEYSPSGAGIRAFFMGSLGNHKSPTTPDQYGLETFASSGFVTFTGNILPHVDILGYEDRVAEAPQELVDMCQNRFGATSSSFDPDDFMAGREPKLGLTVERMQELLDALDPDMGRDEWIRVGMALHHECEGDDTGFYLWHDWSAMGGKYPSEEGLRQQWDSFERRKGVGRRQVTMASVLKLAKEAGQTRPSIATAGELAAAVADVPQAPQRGATPPGFDGKYAVVRADVAMSRPPIKWLIKGVMPKADLAVIFGASGSGKTFVALDMAMALARGVPWRGHRVSEPQRVLYIAAEGAGGLGGRIKAYCRHHSVQPGDLDLSVMFAAPNFMEREDISEVLKAVTAAGGYDVIVVDTFAQVTPGANENAAEDMGHALANVRALREASGAMLWLVHHAGKDASKGARGWSGIKAAADVQIEIVRRENGSREIHLEKLKDGEDGLRWGFNLETVLLGMDEDGDDITSCIIAEAEIVKTGIEPGDGKAKRRGRHETHILEIMTTFGEQDSVSLEELVERAIEAYTPPEEGERDTRRQSIVRAVRRLSAEKDGPLQVINNRVVFYE